MSVDLGSSPDPLATRLAARWNGSRFDPAGSYESWFLRANSPSTGDALWIRYTLFASAELAGVSSGPARSGPPSGPAPSAPAPSGPAPSGPAPSGPAPSAPIGELWAIAFRSGHTRPEIVAAKALRAFDPAELVSSGLVLDLGEARLRDGEANGAVGRLAWDLRWTGGGAPLLLLPERLYSGGFPKAKALVPRPLVRFEGRFTIDGDDLGVDGWIGSQNHNWGSRHTDEYAWGQVAGFDDAPNVFLEVSTARVKLGPLKTPWLTPIVLREEARELRFSSLLRAASNRGHYDERTFGWTFGGTSKGVSIEGRIEAPREAFVALPYANPPGGTKTCLNTKVARCVVRLREGRHTRELVSERRAAFEILTDRTDHGIPVERLPDPRG